MKEIVNGEHFDAADAVLNNNGFILLSIQWESDSDDLRIYYTHIGFHMKLYVYGLPEDIPPEVFRGIVEHVIRTKIRHQKVSMDKTTASWLRQFRATRQAV